AGKRLLAGNSGQHSSRLTTFEPPKTLKCAGEIPHGSSLSRGLGWLSQIDFSRHTCASSRYCSPADSLVGRSRMPRGAVKLHACLHPGRTALISDQKIDWSIPVFAIAVAQTLFREHSPRRGPRRLFRRRDHECHPGVPAVGPVVVGEFPVAF